MAKNRQKLVHLHTPDVKIPSQGTLDLGEIAVQHNNAEPALYIEKTNGEVAKFIDSQSIESKIKVEKLRAEGAEASLSEKIETLSGSNHTHANKNVLDGITSDKVNAWDSAEANAIADAEAKYQVKGNYEAAGAAAQALKDAKSYADGLAVNYDAAGSAADAFASAKTYTDGLDTAMGTRVSALEGDIHTHDNKSVLDGITAVKVATWDAAEANASAYTDAAIVALNLANTYEAKGIAQSLIDGLKLAETYASKEVESKISTLVGEDTGKSVRSVSAEEVAKIVDGADTRYDTLKEIADWIISDTTGAASMANDISALKAISADTRLETLEGKSHSHSNIDLLETYTQTETDLADAVTKRHEHTNKAVLDGITTEKVTAWDAAEGNASAYTDAAIVKLDLANTYEAKGAAAQALKEAKTYADGKADKVHTHAIADVTDLQDALDGKAASTHAHAIADVNGLQGALDGKAASTHAHVIADVTGLQGALDGKAASAHTHAIADVNGLQNALDGKAASTHAHAIADVTGLQDALDGKDSQGAAATALENAKSYTDEKLAAIKIDCGTY